MVLGSTNTPPMPLLMLMPSFVIGPANHDYSPALSLPLPIQGCPLYQKMHIPTRKAMTAQITGKKLKSIAEAAPNTVGVEVAGLLGVLTALVEVGVASVGAEVVKADDD